MDDPPPSLDALSAKLDAVRARQAAEREAATPAGARVGGRSAGLGQAFRIGADLVAAVGVGTGIGFVLDHALGTRPWLLIVFFMLGAAAGMLSVIRTWGGLAGTAGETAGATDVAPTAARAGGGAATDSDNRPAGDPPPGA